MLLGLSIHLNSIQPTLCKLSSMTSFNKIAPTSTLLNNRYQVIRVLGDGGFGTTFLAEDTKVPSKRKCVVKQLNPINDNPQIHQMVQDRFQREATILEKVGEKHDQIPRLYAYFSEGEQFYLVQEWIEGDTLTQKVQREGPQREDTVRSILTGLLPALAHIHQQQIIHRDLKPDNIILRRSDGKPILIDFGAVKETMSTIVNTQGNSSHSIVVGTPGYMPSEQLAGRPVYASDLYSLGLTAIYLLTGKMPQELDTNPMTGEILWQSHAPAANSEFVVILNQAIHPQMQRRFITADAMLVALNAGSSAATPSFVSSQSQPSATEISAPQAYPLSANSQAGHANLPSQATQMIPSPAGSVPSASKGEWKKAVLTGGLIGLSILVGAVVLRAESPGSQSASSQSTQSNSSGNRSSNDANSQEQTSEQPSSTATPGVIRPSASVQAVAPQPVTPPAAPIQPVAPVPQPAAPPAAPIQSRMQAVAPSSTSNTNATIIGQPGSKNIRSGAGTNYRVRHIAYPGDRVQILNSDRDQGGYVWYKVYFPISGADGWIAAQLIQVD